MRSVAMNILLAVVMQAHAMGLTANHSGKAQNSPDKSANKLFDSNSIDKMVAKFVNKLFNRALKVFSLHHSELENMTIGKHGPFVNPAETSSKNLLTHRHPHSRSGDSTSPSASYQARFHRKATPAGHFQASAQSHQSGRWQRLPHVELERREMLLAGSVVSMSSLSGDGLAAAASSRSSISAPRSLVSVDEHLAIPVWPTWAGGRVVPVSLGSTFSDPFLLLAHHKHWFDPRDPLREPFKAFGKVTGLPYIDKEGFSMHPHRGMDILTYVLDGSDGFRHRDSLGGSRTYRGGTAQWMRCGSGVLHEEFWETSPDRRTNVELFQIWINLPGKRKFDEPAIHYVGADTDQPWIEDKRSNVMVRNIGDTIDYATVGSERSTVNSRPPMNLQHVKIDPGAEWMVTVPRHHSALLYVREGKALLPGSALLTSSEANGKPAGQIVSALQSATFARDSDIIVIHNANRGRGDILDLLLLTGAPLREPVAMGGPVVMNTQEELDDAFDQLSDGTFLDREKVLRQHAKRGAQWG